MFDFDKYANDAKQKLIPMSEIRKNSAVRDMIHGWTTSLNDLKVVAEPSGYLVNPALVDSALQREPSPNIDYDEESNDAKIKDFYA